jgi:hypothetical protein
MKLEQEQLHYTRTDAINEKIEEVSNIIKELNITHEQNEQLVKVLTELQNTTEKEILVQGMSIFLNLFQDGGFEVVKKEGL